MGIDAQLYFTSPTQITKPDLLKFSYRLYEAFWGEPFWLWDDRHIIEPLENNTIVQDGPDNQLKDFGYQVYLSGRYYGIGYERGSITDHIAIAEWLEANVKGCKLLYGGDSSGVCAKPFGEKERAVLKAHFHSVGHLPYRSGFGRNELSCLCSRCNEPMNNTGGGGNLTFWSCGGCDEKAVGTNPLTPERRVRGNKQDSFQLAEEIRREQAQ